MSVEIRYARVGNAEPTYILDWPQDIERKTICNSVECVIRTLQSKTKKSVRIACKEAREEGVSYYFS